MSCLPGLHIHFSRLSLSSWDQHTPFASIQYYCVQYYCVTNYSKVRSSLTDSRSWQHSASNTILAQTSHVNILIIDQFATLLHGMPRQIYNFLRPETVYDLCFIILPGFCAIVQRKQHYSHRFDGDVGRKIFTTAICKFLQVNRHLTEIHAAISTPGVRNHIKHCVAYISLYGEIMNIIFFVLYN